MIRAVHHSRLVAPCINALSTTGGSTPNVSRRLFGKKGPNDEKKTPVRFTRVFDPDLIQKRMDRINDRLREAEMERYGMYRGRAHIMKLLREEAPSKRKRGLINSQVAMAKLATLLFEKFALQQGQQRLKEVKPRATAEAFFGPETKENIPYTHARLILLELWRYGRSNLLEGIRKKHLAEMARSRENSERAKANKQKWNEEDPPESSDPGQTSAIGKGQSQSLSEPAADSIEQTGSRQS
jgi:hypothetical protein